MCLPTFYDEELTKVKGMCTGDTCICISKWKLKRLLLANDERGDSYISWLWLNLSVIPFSNPAFDFLENFEIPATNPGLQKFLPGFLKNSGFPGWTPRFLNFLVGSRFEIWRLQIQKTQILEIILTFYEAIFSAEKSQCHFKKQKSVLSEKKLELHPEISEKIEETANSRL